MSVLGRYPLDLAYLGHLARLNPIALHKRLRRSDVRRADPLGAAPCGRARARVRVERSLTLSMSMEKDATKSRVSSCGTPSSAEYPEYP